MRLMLDALLSVSTADDAVEEDLEQIPSISNLKSRFEQQNEQDHPAEKERKASTSSGSKKWKQWVGTIQHLVFMIWAA